MAFFPKGRMGCANCRSRRIKCNELRPACSQCARAGFVCSGYRTLVDLTFVDQTEKISRKLLARQDGKDISEVENKVSAVGNNLLPSCPAPPHQSLQSQPSPSYALSMPIESMAQAFYFNTYAIVGPTCPYSEQGHSRRPFADLASITAVGMAGLANLKQDLSLMVLARTKYESSLRLIKNFLQSVPDILKERTVAVVFMMSMFEMIACEDSGAVESWLSHMQGVTALVELRSSDDWKATTNLKGFLQVCYISAMGCLIKNTPVSTPIAELVKSSEVFQAGVEILPASQLFHIIYGLSQIRASVTIHDTTSLVDIISKAIGIDNDLSSWVSELPLTWRYRTVEWETEDIIYGTYYHTYRNSWHVCVWNSYRICRILLHAVLLNTMNTLESTVSLARPDLASAYQLQRAKSQSVLSIVPSEIRASIPYQLGLLNRANSDNTSIPKPSTVFSLLGLVQVFISSTDASLVTCDWMVKTLELIGHKFGIRQALMMRSRLIEE